LNDDEDHKINIFVAICAMNSIVEKFQVRVDEEGIEKAVEEKADQFYDSWLRKKFDPPKRVVSFLRKTHSPS
jgi:hypothetical protein